ncbi:conserved hypothetical protein [Candida tropicalis MYA-3404]|uniref:Uncharacterized protein n=1 Tax=Candida tropicalis (strain ATCC MYA-3404 / T1) TaxID=294747 RepID=C5MI61_CANTT|nr:conserved hypothetical protein [Candida tropicalis MYA-3404]EER30758.1 conserved hypothetical protein [Candida tropicalis MYA-3404]KAG4409171.1 hypothetical protein JTP64_002477 [Candida tropicalis]
MRNNTTVYSIMRFPLILIFLLQSIIVVTIFIDLDTQNVTDIDHYSISNRSLVTPFVLQILFWKNPKTIISFNDTNTTIVPSDEILVTPDDEIHRIRNLKFVEISYIKRTLHTTLVPLTPCVSRKTITNNQKLNSSLAAESSPVGVAITHRTSIYSRLSLGLGFSLGEAILINAATIGFTLGYKLTAKITKQRMIDTTIGCYSDKADLSTRVFGYIPMLEVTPQIRKIIYDRKKVIVDHAWENLKPRRIMIDSPIRTMCDIGTREDLDCDANNGEVIDKNGNCLTWNIL